jgi:lipopolysaccharide/colanic/teichoic acid biosynthesis glycosyltransferase
MLTAETLMESTIRAKTTRRRGKQVAVGLAAASLVTSFIVLPPIYVFLVFGPGSAAILTPDIVAHFALNCSANALVMLLALLVKGRFDRKLASVLTFVFLIHGLSAYLILVTRSFYSNEAMLYAAGFSGVLGSIVMYLKHEVYQPRVVLLGPVPAGLRLDIVYDHVENPETDLRVYDTILTTSVTELSVAWTRALSQAMLSGKPVRHVAEYAEEAAGLVSIDHFDLDHLPPTGLTSYRTRKRLIDVVLAVLSLPVTLPALAIGATIVALTMGQPIIFKQTRTGLGGRPFEIYKLRTMTYASEVLGSATTAGDMRITRSGRWLRRYRIDELPQIFNVLKGDMSIIGPRPEWTILSERYAREVPAYEYRHLVRPGITGWAQVKGGYASDLEETRRKVGYDLFYIKNLSFALDMQILFRTVLTVLNGFGVR